MEPDTELHRGLGCRLSPNKSYLEAVGSTVEAGGFVHESAETRTVTLFILI